MTSTDNATMHAQDLLAQNGETQICATCNAAMTMIGRLPSVLLQPAVQVFRCFSCNSVMSAEHSPSAQPSIEARVPGP